MAHCFSLWEGILKDCFQAFLNWVNAELESIIGQWMPHFRFLLICNKSINILLPTPPMKILCYRAIFHKKFGKLKTFLRLGYSSNSVFLILVSTRRALLRWDYDRLFVFFPTTCIISLKTLWGHIFVCQSVVNWLSRKKDFTTKSTLFTEISHFF